jgi:hypothetical protein
MTFRHLVHYVQNMVDQIVEKGEDMLSQGSSRESLPEEMDGIAHRLCRYAENHKVLHWGIFGCRKDGPVF